MSLIKTEGYVLKNIEFRETSRIITLFSRDYGVISIMIKGGRKNNTFSPEIFDTYSKSSFVLYTPHSGEMYKHKESSLITSGIPFSKNIVTFFRVSFIFEIVLKVLPKHIPSNDIYCIVDNVLFKLFNHVNNDKNILYIYYFILNLLNILGYDIDTKHCIKCKTPLNSNAFFSSKGGGFFCSNCLNDNNFINTEINVIATLDKIKNGNLKSIDYNIFESERKRIKNILISSLMYHLGLDIEKYITYI
ncbi:DNA repair protein RecO [candidate division TA06 bacterium]|mgnify:FL=1|uniref:DNA repair protein RecO n=1 Tax=candidate division TA06 bacterium TaxID=2250710 RepID=A0A660SNQ6_UNCT6|nr:MAG: DNA repair protein RecO [candidate division TA06 bacterium]